MKNLFSAFAAGLEQRFKLNEAVSVLANAGGVGRMSDAGILVTPQTALRLSTVNTCVKILATTLASVNVTLMQREGLDQREATEHPHYHLVRGAVNRDFVSAKSFFETGQGHVGHRGNAYAQIFPRANGEVELFTMHPDRTFLRRDPRNGRLFYEYTGQGDEYELRERPHFLPQPEVLHVKGFSPNGLLGYDPLSLQRETIGLGVALKKFGASYFAKGTAPSGVLTYPKDLDEEALKRIDAEWKATRAGVDNPHGVPILHGGVQFEAIEIRADNAQFIQTMGYNRAELASFYQVPLSMVGDQSPTSYNSLEMFDLAFRIYGMLQHYRAWEAELNMKLLTALERAQGYFFWFKADGLSRADMKTRQEFYKAGRQWGYLSANDCRRFEKLPPIENGDDYLQPLNMVPAGASPAMLRDIHRAAAPGLLSGGGVPIRQQLPPVGLRQRRNAYRDTHRTTIRDAAGRIISREVKLVKAAIRSELRKNRDGPTLRAELDLKYRSFGNTIGQILEPALLAYADTVRNVIAEDFPDSAGLETEVFVERYVRDFTRRHIGSSMGQIDSVIESNTEDLGRALEERMGQWEERRPDKITSREVVQFGEAVAAASFFSGGV